jgi:NADPH:quinone reductase-like Zn-dependent oxidoreductase
MLDKRVLITGASGGVGRFAIQLAHLAGAHVTAVARRTAGLAELGADEVLSELEDPDPAHPDFAVILDAVGGPVLGTCLQRVAPGGTVVSFASTVTDPVTYPTRQLFARAPGARLYGLYIFAELQHTRSASADLRRLAELIASGRLDPQIDVTEPWEHAADAIQSLLDRRVAGKAVLTIR